MKACFSWAASMKVVEVFYSTPRGRAACRRTQCVHTPGRMFASMFLV